MEPIGISLIIVAILITAIYALFTVKGKYTMPDVDYSRKKPLANYRKVDLEKVTDKNQLENDDFMQYPDYLIDREQKIIAAYISIQFFQKLKVDKKTGDIIIDEYCEVKLLRTDIEELYKVMLSHLEDYHILKMRSKNMIEHSNENFVFFCKEIVKYSKKGFEIIDRYKAINIEDFN